MARLTADTATRQIKKAIEENGMSLVLESKNSDRVDYTITYTKNNAQIRAFFDLSAQLFGFIMFNNGVKTYDKIETFSEMLSVYMYINTELIPITQQIAELYSHENGLNVKYITFTGNMTEGFTTQFEVAGEARFIFVTEQEDNVYRLTLVESFDKKKYKTLDMYLYIRQENGTFEKRFMILSAANKLFDKCFELGEEYKLKRTDTNTFEFEYDELKVEFSLNIGENIEYAVTKVNNEIKEFNFILDDFLDIDSFIAAVLDRIGGKLGSVGNSAPKVPTYDNADSTSDVDAVPEEDIGFDDMEEPTDTAVNESEEIQSEESKVEEEEDSDDLFDFTEEETTETTETTEELDTTEENVETESVEETNEETIEEDTIEVDETEETAEEIVEENVEETNEDTEETVETEETNVEEMVETEETNIEETVEESAETEEPTEELEESTEEQVNDMTEQETQGNFEETLNDTNVDDIVISKLMRNDEIVGLMFNLNGTLYIANIESLKEYKIPYRRLSNSETEVQKKGYTIWESESKLKTFADDISEDSAKIKQLYELMF